MGAKEGFLREVFSLFDVPEHVGQVSLNGWPMLKRLLEACHGSPCAQVNTAHGNPL
jgi:hypothetical protein